MATNQFIVTSPAKLQAANAALKKTTVNKNVVAAAAKILPVDVEKLPSDVDTTRQIGLNTVLVIGATALVLILVAMRR